ncbi:hypothetical protein BV898_07339 [Hypsibius exemplaris]|uniref:WW domain-containing protein n=1 Tax=Hypsibius exemplaris TaxID=2072580 RepID=A0A1W0WTJ2_HYPEX|nr:hypothetical protein BV898_07339 [Hypsibius exemplaris]
MNGTKNAPTRTVLSPLGKDHHRGKGSLRREGIKSSHQQNGHHLEPTRIVISGRREEKPRNGNSDPQPSPRRLQSQIVIPARRDTVNGIAEAQRNARANVASSSPSGRRDVRGSASHQQQRRPGDLPQSQHAKELSSSQRFFTAVTTGRESQSFDFGRADGRGNYEYGNRHESGAWNRATASGPGPRPRKRPIPSPSARSAATRTGSSLSKRSDASTNNSISASSRSSARVERFTDKARAQQERSSVKSASRSSSPSHSAAGNGSARKPLKSPNVKVAATLKRKAIKTDCRKRILRSDEIRVERSSTGREYYYNTETKASKWDKPQEWVEAENAAAAAAAALVLPEAVRRSESVTREALGKRKLSELETTTEKSDNARSTKIQRTASVAPAPAAVDMDSLLGSPISDDNDHSSVASPTPSERMDISDAEAASNASISPSKNAATGSSRTSPSRLRKKSVDDERGASPRRRGGGTSSDQTRKTKAPTLEDLKKLEDYDDPDRRRSLKLQRVKEWRSQLGETPAEVSQSPIGDGIAGSPVSSETSTVSPQWPRPTTGARSDHADAVKAESPSADAAVAPTCPSPVPASACSRIVLPSFDFPELPEPVRDLPILFVEAMTSGFTSMKIGHVEDQKCKQLFEIRPGMYAASGEKVVHMKVNHSDIRQKRMTTVSQAEDISFLSSLQDELFRSMHAKADHHNRSEVPKPILPPPHPVVVKTERVDSSPAVMVNVTTTPDISAASAASLDSKQQHLTLFGMEPAADRRQLIPSGITT